MPAVVLEGTTLSALKEESGGDTKVKTVMLVQRNSFICASELLSRVCVLV